MNQPEENKQDESEIDDFNNLPHGAKVWVYVRRGLGNRISLGNQLQMVIKYCEKMGWIVDHVFQDTKEINYRETSCPEFSVMVSQARNNPESAKAIVSWTKDRFCRNSIEFDQIRGLLHELGWKTIFVVESVTASLEFPFHLLAPTLGIIELIRLNELKERTIVDYSI